MFSHREIFNASDGGRIALDWLASSCGKVSSYLYNDFGIIQRPSLCLDPLLQKSTLRLEN